MKKINKIRRMMKATVVMLSFLSLVLLFLLTVYFESVTCSRKRRGEGAELPRRSVRLLWMYRAPAYSCNKGHCV